MSSETPAAPGLPLWLAMLFAILGGLILNLMPCVLPVLSLKILNVVSHGGKDPRVVRHSFLITAAGIVFSFLVLAGGRQSGRHIMLRVRPKSTWRRPTRNGRTWVTMDSLGGPRIGQ